MIRPRAPAPAQPPPCHRCGATVASFGIGPPIAVEQRWFCATCRQFEPATQAALAELAREAIDD